jgi:hypothetical protein
MAKVLFVPDGSRTKGYSKMTAAEASACPRLLDTFLPVDRPDPFQYNKKNQETGKTTEGEITA